MNYGTLKNWKAKENKQTIFFEKWGIKDIKQGEKGVSSHDKSCMSAPNIL